MIPFTSFVLLTHFKINKYLCDLLDEAHIEPGGKKKRNISDYAVPRGRMF